MGKLSNFLSPQGGKDTKKKVPKDKKGVSKKEAIKLKELNFINFFKLFTVRFDTMIKSNGLFLLCNIPIIFALYAAAGYNNLKTRVPVDLFYPNIYGVRAYEGNNAVTSALNGIFGMFTDYSVPSNVTLIFYALSLLCVLTFGLSNVGVNYVMRETVRGKVVMAWADFWSTIKKNWKQALLLGVFDITIIFLLIYDLIVFYQTSNDTTGAIGFTAILILSFTYLIMRNYIYLLCVTFDFKFTKVINYAFRLALLGIKRNILGVIGIMFAIYLNYMVAVLFLPLGLLLPFIFTVGISSFIGAYTAWPIVDKYLVDKDIKKKSTAVFEYYDIEPEETN